jgi:hypothetical protein
MVQMKLILETELDPTGGAEFLTLATDGDLRELAQVGSLLPRAIGVRIAEAVRGQMAIHECDGD